MGYEGYFLQGLAGGLQTGMNLAQQKSEMDWQKKQRKKLEEAETKLTEEAVLYNSVVTQAGADGFYSEDDIMRINTTYLALGHRTQESLKSAHNALLTMDKATFDREMEYFNGTIELLKSGLLDPKDATAVFEYGRNNWAISEKIKNLYEAADNIYAKSHGKLEEERTWEKVGKLPSEARVPFLEQKGIEMPEIAPETSPTELDRMAETEKWLDAAYATGNATYFNRIAKERGSPATFETYKQKYKEPEIPKITPEGEISAGEKRTFDMASSVMFGSSDWVTGISKPGVISMDISNKLNMGQPLTEEENAEVRNSYNLIKNTLPDEVRNVMESQLKRYGISLEAPIKEPEPLPEPKTKEWWEFWKKGETLTPEVTPKAGEIPLPKVPTGEKEALIPMMTKKELEDAIKGLDSSDPMYKLLYDEAVKRGYITK